MIIYDFYFVISIFYSETEMYKQMIEVYNLLW